MKKTIILISLISSLQALAITKNVTGQKARDLVQALFQSGVQIEENINGFKTKSPLNITCKGTLEHAISGGYLQQAPHCHSDTNSKLENTVSLITALENAGADSDAAMGSYYVGAKEINCVVNLLAHEANCTLTTDY